MSAADLAEAHDFRNFKFVAGAESSTSIPVELRLPQIAFVGRSNVGKSSVINALAQSTIVRVSKTPGLTRALNFFQLGRFGMAVDMPGYGFAFAKEEEKKGWQSLIYDYLENSKTLKRLFVLLDSRHGIKVIDREFLNSLEETKVKYQIVLTKADLITPIDLARRYTLVRDALANYRHCIHDVLMVSSRTGAGLPKLRRVIRQVLDPSWRPAAPAVPGAAPVEQGPSPKRAPRRQSKINGSKPSATKTDSRSPPAHPSKSVTKPRPTKHPLSATRKNENEISNGRPLKKGHGW